MSFVVCMIVALNAAGQTGPREPHNFLKNHIGFKESDFQAMERGQAIAKVLLIEYVPELNRYLDGYPMAKPDGAEDFLYWSKVKFGLKPTVRLSHVAIWPYSRKGRDSIAIASKMLYASHYFHTALELKVLVRDSAKPDAKGFYLISLNRSRSDGLTGFFGGIVRSKAEFEPRKGMTTALDSGRDVLEAASRRTSSEQ